MIDKSSVVLLGSFNEVNIDLVKSFERLSSDVISYDPNYSDTLLKTRFRNIHCFKYHKYKFSSAEHKLHLFLEPRRFHSSYQPLLPQLISQQVIFEVQKLFGSIMQISPMHNQSAWIGVNQVRMISKDNIHSYPAPGFHQDGYHQSVHLCINKQNIDGGTSIISTNQDGSNIVFKKSLAPGEFIFFDDTKYYHTATAIKNDRLNIKAFRDMLIFDIIYW